MTRQQLVHSILGVACTVLTACGDSTAPGSTQPLSLDAALAEVNSAQTYSTAGLAAGGMVLPIPINFLAPPSNCPFNASTNSFVCPGRSVGGLTSTIWFQLFDDSNQPLTEFNPNTVAAIRMVIDMSGTLAANSSSTSLTTTLARHSDQTLSGLRTDRHTLNGTGTTNITTTIGSQTVSGTGSDKTTDVVLPPPGSATHWPLSGSISMDLSSGMGGTAFSSSFTMTFNGTSKVMITMTFGGTTRTCTLDLSAPATPGGCF